MHPQKISIQGIEAEVSTTLGDIKIVRQSWTKPVDKIGSRPEHHLQLTLLPLSKSARGSFPDYWGPDRFEPLGSLFLFPADQTVRAKSGTQQQNSIICSFKPTATANWLEQDLQWTDTHLQKILNIPSPAIRNLMLRIGEEIRNPGFANEPMLEMMSGQLAIELSRFIAGIEEEPPSGGLSSYCLKLIDQRLFDHPAPPSLTELSDICGLSVRHLTRAFRVSRGCSIGNYIASSRIKHAKELLASGLSVKAVAYETGFSAPSNFSAAFLRETGETPRQFKMRACRVVKPQRRTHDVH